MGNIEVLIPLTMFAGIFGVLYIFFVTRNKERMAMIEKGASAELLTRKPNGFGALKFGIMFVGVALGILIGHMVHVNAGLQEEISMFSMIFLFGGTALMAYYFIARKMASKSEE